MYNVIVEVEGNLRAETTAVTMMRHLDYIDPKFFQTGTTLHVQATITEFYQLAPTPKQLTFTSESKVRT